MTRDEIENRIKPLIADELEVPIAQITGASTLVADLGADSLGLLSLGMAVEDSFGIHEELDVHNIHTVDDVIDYVQSQLNRPAPEAKPRAIA